MRLCGTGEARDRFFFPPEETPTLLELFLGFFYTSAAVKQFKIVRQDTFDFFFFVQ